MLVEIPLDPSPRKRRAQLSLPLPVAATVMAATSRAAEPAAGPRVDSDGVAQLPAVTVPSSEYLSAESRSRFIALFSSPRPHPTARDIRQLRAAP